MRSELIETNLQRAVGKSPLPPRTAGGGPTSIGRYQVVRLIGAGACGRVYACHDPLLDRPVALKVLHPDLPQERRALALERFGMELRVLGRVNHPNIIAVHDACLEGEAPFLVMELCSGPTLSGFLARTGRLSPGLAAHLFHQAAVALDHVHALGIVHRDVKPSNFIFQHQQLKLTDFGVARAGFIASTLGQELVGTPSYMSPEQFAGEEVTPRSDLFSLAATLYELLTGRAPFVGDATSVLYARVYDAPPQATNDAPDLVPDFDEYFERALSRDPSARFASGAEMCAALSRIVPEHELERVSAGPVERLAPPPPTTYGYSKPVVAGSSYVSTRPVREPPPPQVPEAERIRGAAPAPWMPTERRRPHSDILEFDGNLRLRSLRAAGMTDAARRPQRAAESGGPEAREALSPAGETDVGAAEKERAETTAVVDGPPVEPARAAVAQDGSHDLEEEASTIDFVERRPGTPREIAEASREIAAAAREFARVSREFAGTARQTAGRARQTAASSRTVDTAAVSFDPEVIAQLQRQARRARSSRWIAGVLICVAFAVGAWWSSSRSFHLDRALGISPDGQSVAPIRLVHQPPHLVTAGKPLVLEVRTLPASRGIKLTAQVHHPGADWRPIESRPAPDGSFHVTLTPRAGRLEYRFEASGPGGATSLSSYQIDVIRP